MKKLLCLLLSVLFLMTLTTSTIKSATRTSWGAMKSGNAKVNLAPDKPDHAVKVPALNIMSADPVAVMVSAVAVERSPALVPADILLEFDGEWIFIALDGIDPDDFMRDFSSEVTGPITNLGRVVRDGIAHERYRVDTSIEEALEILAQMADGSQLLLVTRACKGSYR